MGGMMQLILTCPHIGALGAPTEAKRGKTEQKGGQIHKMANIGAFVSLESPQTPPNGSSYYYMDGMMQLILTCPQRGSNTQNGK